jgi:GNAT superfamily N-acetyltransferase
VNTTLRPAAVEDAARVAEVLIGTRAAFMPYAPSAHSEDEVCEWLAQSLIPSGGVIVAERQGTVVAMMATEQAEECSRITQMAVDPGLVGQGIGSFLLVHAMHTLRRPVRLWTFQANTGARRFYERHGFLAIQFTDGQGNEERCPDILYELTANRA